jgi:hypothetical protein
VLARRREPTREAAIPRFAIAIARDETEVACGQRNAIDAATNAVGKVAEALCGPNGGDANHLADDPLDHGSIRSVHEKRIG